MVTKMYLKKGNGKERAARYEYNIFTGQKKPWKTGEGENISLYNISSDRYPQLSPRAKYAVNQTSHLLTSIGSAADELYYTTSNGFYYSGTLFGSVSFTQKHFLNFQKMILIFPDKKYFDTDNNRLGNLVIGTGAVSILVSSTKRLSENPGLNTLTGIDGVKLSDYFESGDGVYISGGSIIDGSYTVRGTDNESGALYFDDGQFGEGDGFSADVTLSNGVPDGGAMCVCQNRVWTYSGNRIFASAPGDPFIWRRYDGDENSCFFAESGEFESFTYCTEMEGYPVFFTPSGIYKVYGDCPANYCLSRCATYGGMSAFEHYSAAYVGSDLMYLSDGKVMRFSGGKPEADESFPGIGANGGVGGSDGERYYLSAQISSGQSVLYVYDMYSGKWQQYSELGFQGFARCGNAFYGITESDIVILKTSGFLPSDFTEEGAVTSTAEFSDVYFDSPVYPYRLGAVLETGTDGEVDFSLMYDGNGEWYDSGEVGGNFKGMKLFDFVPVRCDSWRLKVQGSGNYAIKKIWVDYTLGQ